MKKIIISVALIVLTSVVVFAETPEEELLDLYFNATNYSVYDLIYNDSRYDEFTRDNDTANNKWSLYKEINDFEWGCVEPECYGDFVESLRLCTISLVLLHSKIYLLRLTNGDSTEAKEKLNEAENYLIEANKAWKKILEDDEIEDTENPTEIEDTENPTEIEDTENPTEIEDTENPAEIEDEDPENIENEDPENIENEDPIESDDFEEDSKEGSGCFISTLF